MMTAAPCDIDFQIAEILKRCHIIQAWMVEYQPYLPVHVIFFFNAMLMHLGRETLLITRVVGEVTKGQS
jgi:hypothetical protein